MNVREEGRTTLLAARLKLWHGWLNFCARDRPAVTTGALDRVVIGDVVADLGLAGRGE